MRNVFLLSLGAALVFSAACSSGPDATEGPDDSIELWTAPKGQWGPYLRVMTDLERERFLAIESGFERDLWLRRNGIDVRAELENRLSRGMSVADARRRITEQPDEELTAGSSTTLFYSRFNTGSRTNFYLNFDSGKLVSWNSYTMEQQDRQRELVEFEARLMRVFNSVLERGMGPAAIRRQAENAREDLNRVELAHRETTTGGRGSEYRGIGGASYSQYIVAENLLYARNRNELFQWFQGREPDQVIIQRPFERHLYNMLHRDARGRETIVTAEFAFESGGLVAWYVYHEK